MPFPGSTRMNIEFTVERRFITDRCTYCDRPRQLWGNRNGWCLRCLQWYRRNGADYIIRCLGRHGWQRLPLTVGARVLDYMAGSTRARQAEVDQIIWLSVLLGKYPGLEYQSESDEDDEPCFERKVAHPETPLFWKLQFSLRPQYSTSGLPYENLINHVLPFLVGERTVRFAPQEPQQQQRSPPCHSALTEEGPPRAP